VSDDRLVPPYFSCFGSFDPCFFLPHRTQVRCFYFQLSYLPTRLHGEAQNLHIISRRPAGRQKQSSYRATQASSHYLTKSVVSASREVSNYTAIEIRLSVPRISCSIVSSSLLKVHRRSFPKDYSLLFSRVRSLCGYSKLEATGQLFQQCPILGTDSGLFPSFAIEVVVYAVHRELGGSTLV
jgi:hypothetical protein